jgi:hypothetical protein
MIRGTKNGEGWQKRVKVFLHLNFYGFLIFEVVSYCFLHQKMLRPRAGGPVFWLSATAEACVDNG